MFAITIRERSGQVYTFHFDKPEVLIGRVKGNDVILPKQNISKRHTLVKAEGKRFVVEDLGSTNGTYVNGHRIATAVEVGADDKVYIGDFVMNFTDLNDMSSSAPPEVPPGLELGAGFSDADLPEISGIAASAPAESAQSIRATQHMQGPIAVPPPTNLADMDLGEGFGDGLMSDLPAVEPLDMPNELVQLQGESQEPDYFERLTGPVDAMAQANMFRPGSALANIPGLAGAIKAPTTGPQAAAAPPKAPVALPNFAPAPAEAARAAAFTSGQMAADGHAPAPHGSFGAAAAAAHAPAPAAPPARVPELPELPSAPPPEGHHDQLAVLFRNAMRDLRPALPSDASQMSDSDWAEMEDRVTAFVDQCAVAGEIPPEADVARLRLELIYELAGLGPLELMLDDAEIEAIEVNGPAQVYVVRRGKREAATERFSCQQALALAVDRLVRATGQTGRSGTSLEGTLVDGTSVFVVWPPLCPAGPAVLLRKPRTDAPDLEQLVGRGTVTPQVAETLAELVARNRSIAVVGPPRAGKRTVLNALTNLIQPDARLVVLEDGQRLRLHHDHVVRVDAASFNDGAHSSPLRVVQRLRPDWLLIGDSAAVGPDELFAVQAEGLPPWIAVFSANDGPDFLERAKHSLLMRYPGLPESVAEARALRGLDAVAVFGPDGAGGWVLGEVFEVARHRTGGRTLVDLSPEAVRAAL
jgi:pilus assembly protein CpaF